MVFTDAYTHAWEPSDKPFMTCIITFENEGWGKSTDQLAELLAIRGST